VEYVIRRMRDLAPESHSFILDMHKATGISESAARLLNAARRSLAEDGIAVVCSRIHGRQPLLAALGKSVRGADRGFLVFEDNDLAVEWCENRLFGEASGAPAEVGSLADFPLFRGIPEALVERVAATTRTARFAPGERILTAGQVGDGRIYLIESGQASILVPLESGAHQRIASLGPGFEFGEMALLGQTTRSASVYADTAVRCRILEVCDFERLADEAPLLKIMMLENLAKDMAEKLRLANQWIAALA
jgi:hypothetical protein